MKVDSKGEFEVVGVDKAFNRGPQVHPDRIRSQLEGSVLMGTGLAKYGEISFKDGRVFQSNFDDHVLLRHNERPGALRVHLDAPDHTVAQSGVDEPGLPAVAPALINALFAATGLCIRQLPIRDQVTSTG